MERERGRWVSEDGYGNERITERANVGVEWVQVAEISGARGAQLRGWLDFLGSVFPGFENARKNGSYSDHSARFSTPSSRLLWRDCALVKLEHSRFFRKNKGEESQILWLLS